jgi:hypothetical protein
MEDDKEKERKEIAKIRAYLRKQEIKKKNGGDEVLVIYAFARDGFDIEFQGLEYDGYLPRTVGSIYQSDDQLLLHIDTKTGKILNWDPEKFNAKKLLKTIKTNDHYNDEEDEDEDEDRDEDQDEDRDEDRDEDEDEKEYEDFFQKNNKKS